MTACVFRRQRCWQRGFSQFELVASFAVIAVVAGILLTRLLYIEELAEKTAVDLTILNIRSGIRMEIARRILDRAPLELKSHAAQNPVRWLEQPPPAYLGELRGREPANPAGGSWYYDADRRELVYVPRLSFHLRGAENTLPAIRWRLRLRSAGSGVPADDGIHQLVL